MKSLRSFSLFVFIALTAPFAFAQTDTSAPVPQTVTDQNVAPVDPAANLSTQAKKVIRLADSRTDKSEIVDFIKNSKVPFRLTAEDVIYLRDVGIDTDIITAMLNHDVDLRGNEAGTEAAQNPSVPQTAPLTPSTVATTAPPEVTPFYNTLSPYGTWVNIEGQGLAWQPNVVVAEPGWQPYCDAGRWVWSDCGWYWASDYSWGWAPFHYGRWWRSPAWGWVWFPGDQWAPSWVTWRTYGDYCGWAPLPPGALFVGTGFSFGNSFVGFDFDFGLSSDCFTFVEFPFFFRHDFRHHRLGRDRVNNFFRRSTVVNNFSRVNNNIVINNGLPLDRVRRATRTSVRTVPVVDSAPAPRPHRNTQITRGGQIEAVTRTPIQSLRNSRWQSVAAEPVWGSKPIVPTLPNRLAAPTRTTTSGATSTFRQGQTTLNSTTPSQTAATLQQGQATLDPNSRVRQQQHPASPTQAGPPLWSGRHNVAPDEKQLWSGSREQSLTLPSQRTSRGELPSRSATEIRDPAGAARTPPVASPSAPAVQKSAPVQQSAPPSIPTVPRVNESRVPSQRVVPPLREEAPRMEVPRSSVVAPSAPLTPRSAPAVSVPRYSPPAVSSPIFPSVQPRSPAIQSFPGRSQGVPSRSFSAPPSFSVPRASALPRAGGNAFGEGGPSRGRGRDR